MRVILSILVLLFVSHQTIADTIVLNSGSKISGVVIYQDKDQVRMWTDLGINTFQSSEFSDLQRDKAAATQNAARIGDIKLFLATAAKNGWGKDLRQIPATVIDKGVLQRVPYLSFQYGEYEMNIYGDLTAPACIEIGVRGTLLKDAAAKTACKKFIKSVLSDAKDHAVVDAFGNDAETHERADYTLELTPPEAEDSYGGWWISAYSKKLLDSSRASEKEMDAITVKIPTPPKANEPAKPAVVAKTPDAYAWKPDEFESARKPVVTPTPSTYSGTVYVRGYYRKDGTYVRPHTRSK